MENNYHYFASLLLSHCDKIWWNEGIFYRNSFSVTAKYFDKTLCLSFVVCVCIIQKFSKATSSQGSTRMNAVTSFQNTRIWISEFMLGFSWIAREVNWFLYGENNFGYKIFISNEFSGGCSSLINQFEESNPNIGCVCSLQFLKTN